MIQEVAAVGLDLLQLAGNQNAGPAVLPALAQIIASLLQAPVHDLLDVAPGRRLQTDYEDVSLEPLPQPPQGFPAEEEGVPPASDEAPVSGGSPRAVQPTRAEPVLDHARDIPISGGDHQTMFGRKIQSMRDLPAEARPIFELVSRSPEVLEIDLGRFRTKGGRAAGSFTLLLSEPREGMRVIHGKVHGPGASDDCRKSRSESPADARPEPISS